MFSVPMSAVNMFHDTSFHGTYRHVVVHTPTPSFQVEREKDGKGLSQKAVRCGEIEAKLCSSRNAARQVTSLVRASS